MCIIMENYKPISYFIVNKLTTLCAKTIKRRVKLAYSNGDSSVRKVYNKTKRPQYEILVEDFDKFASRIRKPKKIKIKVLSESTPKTYQYYRTVVTINLKDNYEADFYKELVENFFIKSKCHDMFYSIEVDDENFTHIHLATTGGLELTKCTLDELINSKMKMNQRIAITQFGIKSYAPVEISSLCSLEAFTDYCSKQSHLIFLNTTSQKWA